MKYYSFVKKVSTISLYFSSESACTRASRRPAPPRKPFVYAQKCFLISLLAVRSPFDFIHWQAKARQMFSVHEQIPAIPIYQIY